MYILLCMNIKIKFWFVLIYKILCNVNNKGFLFVWLLNIKLIELLLLEMRIIKS